MESVIEALAKILANGGECKCCPLIRDNKIEEFKQQTSIRTCALVQAMLSDNMEIKMHAYNIADEAGVTSVAMAATKSHPHVAKALMFHPKLDKSRLFVAACKYGHKDIAMEMVAKGVDPSYDSNEGLRRAMSKGRLEVFNWLMTQKSVVDSLEDSDTKLALEQEDPAYIKALYSISGHIQKKWLKRITNPEIYKYVRSLSPKLQSEDNNLLHHNVCTGNVEMIKYLLTVTDPTKCSHNLYYLCSTTQRTDIVDVLNADGRVDITQGGTNLPLKVAISGGNTKMVYKLMQNEKVYMYVLKEQL